MRVKINMGNRPTYTEDQKTALLELAQEVGLGRAIRELGYPTYPTAMYWARQRNVVIDVDPIKQRAAQTAQWYADDEKKLVAQAGLERIYEQLKENTLTADDINKLANATKKYVEIMAMIDGKPTSITQEITDDGVFEQLLKEINMSHRDLETQEER